MFEINKELKFNSKEWNLFNKQISSTLEFANIKICEYGEDKIVYLSTLYLKNKGDGQDPMLKIILAELREFKQEVNTRLDRIENRLDIIEEDVKVLKEDVAVLKKDVVVLKEDVAVLKEDVAVLKKDVNLIKQCPTIKKELVELNAN